MKIFFDATPVELCENMQNNFLCRAKKVCMSQLKDVLKNAHVLMNRLQHSISALQTTRCSMFGRRPKPNTTKG